MLAAPRAERYQSIDMLRGVAVLGILMMNVQGFAMVFPAYSNPLAHMDFTGANQDVWFAAHVFFEMKFITIFSALFGAGILLMVGKGNESGAVKRHYRRMLWLLLFGAIHAYVLWWGDILFPYALWGMVAVLMRKMKARPLFLIGLGLFALSCLVMWGYYASMGMLPPESLEAQWAPPPDMLQEMVAAQQAGGLERLAANALTALGAQFGGAIFFGPRLLGMMLLGMALYKWRFFTAEWSAKAYAIGALVGLPLSIGAAWWGGSHHIETGFALDSIVVGGMSNVLFSPLASFGYACVAMLICKAPGIDLLRRPFAAVGRMALTNYLMHSLIGFFIFAGPPGLGLFGEWERVQQFQLVLAVWAAQLILSPLWLSVFRFGPFEWLWRSLTYGRPQPFLKSGAAPQPSAGASG